MGRARCALCGQPDDKSAKPKAITLRRVPANKYIRSKWQEFCSEVYKLPRSTIKINGSRVCSLHFTDDCFYTRNGLVHTKPFAVPTLFVEPVKRKITEKKNNRKISVPITSSGLCEEPYTNLLSTGMDTVSFSPLSVKIEECVKKEEYNEYDEMTMPYLKEEFDQIENYEVVSENNRFQSCESLLVVMDDYTKQSCDYNEGDKIFNNIEEKNRELSRQIREKSESLIQFIESVTKSSTSYQPNEKGTSNDGSLTVNQPQEREIPLRHVVDYMKKARANKKCKKNLVLSKQIKEKSESLTEYIESAMKPSTSSYKSIKSDSDSGDTFNQRRKNDNHNSDLEPSEYYGKKNICVVGPIKSDDDYDWKQK